jgi:two-component system, sensor histidine kinase and response regulator
MKPRCPAPEIGSSAAADRNAVQPRSVEHQIETRHRGARVLIVEDDVFGQEIIAEYVGAVGLAVELAGDGVEALQKAQDAQYDLILMDIQMPRMDGLEATQRLRQLPAHSATPIIAVTAHAYAIAEEMSTQAGMNAFLTKPLDPGTLYATLLKWLDSRKLDPAQT